jgi:hypothetical protein
MSSNSNSAFVQAARSQQRQMLSKQDDHLTQLAESTARLNQNARAMQVELEGHNRILTEIDSDVDLHYESMNGLQRTMARVFKTTSRREISQILVLSLVCFALFMWNIS